MDTKGQAKEIWDKISAWGKDRLTKIEPIEYLGMALDPAKKQAVLDEEREYAESIIADALAEQGKEIARMREALSGIAGPVNHDATQPGDNRYQRIARAALLPPDEKKEEPCAGCKHENGPGCISPSCGPPDCDGFEPDAPKQEEEPDGK